MTIIEPTIISSTDIEDIVGEDEPLTHNACCNYEAFFCGAEYHPEGVREAEDAATCEPCEEVWAKSRCSTWYGNRRVNMHLHCPIDGRMCSVVKG